MTVFYDLLYIFHYVYSGVFRNYHKTDKQYFHLSIRAKYRLNINNMVGGIQYLMQHKKRLNSIK